MPEVLPTGRVVWQIVVGVVDGPDADDRPDLIGARGTVAFTASIPSTVNVPGGYSVALTTKVGVLDEEGYLCTPDPADPSKPGVRGMHLFATDNPDLANKDWTWTATPRLKDVNGQRLDNVIKPFSFAVPTMDDETAQESPLDLAVLAPIPASQGLGKEQIAALAATATAAATSSAANAALAREESEHATRIALRVVERADAGEFNGRPGPPGPNTIPAQEFLEQEASDPESALNQALKTKFIQAHTTEHGVDLYLNGVRL